MARLGDVIDLLDGWFDPAWAESWDAVGLVCGDPTESVERILLAVDAVPATVDDAITSGAQLLITHHPLLLDGVHGVPANDPKGALVHRMIRAGLAHFVAHTNADVANPGVSDALAERLGLAQLRPLEATATAGLLKLVVFVPAAHAGVMIDALAEAGAGAIGDYERCAWVGEGQGTFRPLDGARPTIGEIGEAEVVHEARVEMVVPPGRRDAVIAALRAVHPYEEPAFDLLVQAPVPTRRGHGRVGVLPVPMTLREFVRHAATVLPATAGGIRAAGDPRQTVRTVAVCGGAGASLADLARAAGADVYLTADLKHHRTLDAVTEHAPGSMAMVDVAHWASEAPWLDALAARLDSAFGTTVETRISAITTDPWTLHAAQNQDPAAQ